MPEVGRHTTTCAGFIVRTTIMNVKMLVNVYILAAATAQTGRMMRSREEQTLDGTICQNQNCGEFIGPVGYPSPGHKRPCGKCQQKYLVNSAEMAWRAMELFDERGQLNYWAPESRDQWREVKARLCHALVQEGRECCLDTPSDDLRFATTHTKCLLNREVEE